ncbi:MAG: hypothetical protein QXL70_03165 [Metallosphaera sp.]
MSSYITLGDQIYPCKDNVCCGVFIPVEKDQAVQHVLLHIRYLYDEKYFKEK